MQDVKSRHGATLELCLTTNMAAKGICQQEELTSFMTTLASGKPENLDAYCGRDKIIRFYNNFQLGLVGNTMLTLPDGYTLNGMGHNLTVTGGSLTISGDVSELCINGKKQNQIRTALKKKKCNRTRGCKPETEAKYRPALELYTATDFSTAEICRQCEVSEQGFKRHVYIYHRHLMLETALGAAVRKRTASR